MPVIPRFAARVDALPGSVIDASVGLLQRQTRDVVPFAIGSPPLEAIPAEFDALLSEVAGQARSGAFDYGPTEGEASLRRALPHFLADHGDPVADSDLLITTGAMQGLDLAAKLFVDDGDLVVVEGPTYTNALGTMTGYGGQIVEVPSDDQGLNVDALVDAVRRAGRTPKVLYMIPNCQNPAGTTLSLPRRERIVELAAQWDSVIVEDDPYGLLRFDGQLLPSLATLAAGKATVVAVHTFSKILSPGLRVGWVTADSAIIDRMVRARQSMDTCTNVPLQRMIARFLGSGAMDAHLDYLRGLYLGRKKAMMTALADAFPAELATWTDPVGGFFTWVDFHAAVDTTELFPEALERGVAFIPGTAFSSQGNFQHSLRLCYASTEIERIPEGVARLRDTVQAHLSSSADYESVQLT